MTAESRRVAAAVGGAARELGDLARADAAGAIGRRHRVSAALYLGAMALGIDGPALSAWRRDMITMSARYLILSQALEGCSRVLSVAGVSWLPLKGYDLGTRVYSPAEERVTSDLDLLIAAADFERARGALRAAGWDDVSSGPRARRYLAEEGYAWQATGRGVLLEVHFRLWGSVAEGLAAEMIAASAPDLDLPAGGRRLTAAHAFVVAAVHAWLSPPPRGVGIWRDLERLSATGSPSLAVEVVDFARRWDVQLPVGLASEVASKLWRDDICARIAAELGGELRLPERLASAMARRRGAERASHGLLTAARLAAGRRTRLRGKIVWRRFWDHAGVVEAATPEQGSWAARRLSYQLTALGLRKPACPNEGPATAKTPDVRPEP